MPGLCMSADLSTPITENDVNRHFFIPVGGAEDEDEDEDGWLVPGDWVILFSGFEQSSGIVGNWPHSLSLNM